MPTGGTGYYRAVCKLPQFCINAGRGRPGDIVLKCPLVKSCSLLGKPAFLARKLPFIRRADSLCKIGAYCGADAYDRRTRTVVVEGCAKHKADAYVLTADYHCMVNNREWDRHWFARGALPPFIRNYRGFR